MVEVDDEQEELLMYTETICNEECFLGNARREARRDTRLEAAKKLISQGISADTVAKATSLHIIDINNLKEIERLFARARHNEASALDYMQRKTRQETFVEIAKELKSQGISVENIVRSTDLSINEILLL